MIFPWLLLAFSPALAFSTSYNNRGVEELESKATKSDQVLRESTSRALRSAPISIPCEGKLPKKKPSNREQTTAGETSTDARIKARAKRVSMTISRRRSNWLDVGDAEDVEASPKELVYLVFDYDQELSEDDLNPKEQRDDHHSST